MHVPIVVIIRDEVDFANERRTFTRVFKSLVVSKTAPKVNALITSHTVFSILDIPPRDNKSSTTATPLSIENPE